MDSDNRPAEVDAPYEHHVRFIMPDVVAEYPAALNDPDVWPDADPATSDLLYVPAAGCFVRALLKVAMSHGHVGYYGLWVEVGVEDLKDASQVWESPDYKSFSLTGTLANQVAPWDLRGRSVDIGVVNERELPFCLSSDDSLVNQVLTNTWPLSEVEAFLPG